MPVLWLHFGLAKTGSSALQVFFARNTLAFRKQGIIYPWHSHAVEGKVTSGNGLWLAVQHAEEPGYALRLEKLTGYIRNDRNVLLSSEFFETADQPRLERILVLG